MSINDREDYLINILRLIDGKKTVRTTELASYMNIAPASVTEMLKILQKEGLINYEKYHGVSLTDKGTANARALRRRHHILERFLHEVLKIDHQQAHNQACAAEHSISDESATKICRMIGTRIDKDCVMCPDPCTGSGEVHSDCIYLSEMKVGDKGLISHLSSKDEGIIGKLISMGFVPKRPIELSNIISEAGIRIIKIGETNIALDRAMTAAICVDKL
ncbi:MAG: metal-dependent transcriptional regulator [archaeon]|nr:metal-dependent transcriptional regulator [archaeon]